MSFHWKLIEKIFQNQSSRRMCYNVIKQQRTNLFKRIRRLQKKENEKLVQMITNCE